MPVLPTTVKVVAVAIYDRIMAELGGDTVTFNEDIVYLSDEEFTPEINMIPPSQVPVADVNEVEAPIGFPLNQGVDPATGDRILSLRPPAGGFRFVVGDDTLTPHTVYGWVWVDNTKATVRAAALLDAPVTLDTIGQEVVIDNVEVIIPLNGLQ